METMGPPRSVPAPDPSNIFVSYSRVDLAWVDQLVRELQGAGLKVWLDVHKLQPGVAWDSEIEQALQRTGVLMVVLSPDSAKSRNVLDEISFALGKNRLVVPVLYRPCEVPYRVARLQHIDFTGDYEAALEQLVERLKAAVDECTAAVVAGGALHRTLRHEVPAWFVKQSGVSDAAPVAKAKTPPGPEAGPVAKAKTPARPETGPVAKAETTRGLAVGPVSRKGLIAGGVVAATLVLAGAAWLFLAQPAPARREAPAAGTMQAPPVTSAPTLEPSTPAQRPAPAAATTPAAPVSSAPRLEPSTPAASGAPSTAPGAASETQGAATVTLIEGSLKIIRGTTLLLGAEGIRLRPGDILATTDPGSAQLEFVKGPIVALGPSTQVYLLPRPAAGSDSQKAATELVMLSGWLKSEHGQTSTAYRYDTPELASTTGDGTVLLHAGSGPDEIFVESGSAKVAEVSPGGAVAARPAAAKAGQFFSRQAGKPVTMAARPDPRFLQAMPLPFRDTLPSRLTRFSGKAVEPRREHEVSYQEVQPWLTMNRAWRRGFVERFRSRVNDAAFRRALEAHIGEHPEWDPILHPEKYPPKTPGTGADKDSSHGR